MDMTAINDTYRELLDLIGPVVEWAEAKGQGFRQFRWHEIEGRWSYWVRPDEGEFELRGWVDCRFAHALIKDAAREWLRVNDKMTGWWIDKYGDETWGACRLQQGATMQHLGTYPSEPAALLAAVKAVKEAA